MSEVILAALISGAAGVICSVLAAASSNAKYAQQLESRLEKWKAVTDVQISELTREVRKHNNFAERMPVLEDRIKAINYRIKDLEDEQKE